MAGWAVGVWSGSPHLDAAGKWLEFMSSVEADRLWVEVGGQLPGTRETIAAMPEFFAKPENQYLVTAAEGVANYGWIAPVAFSAGGYRQALNRAAQSVITGGTDPKVALEEAERRFNQQHNR